MDENSPAPRLGTPEAAVQAAVNLIAKATGCAEGKLAYYLDMYYQLRVAYEDAKGEEWAEAQLETFRFLEAYREPPRTMNRPGAPETDEPLSVTSASTGDSSPQRGSQEREETPEAAETLRAKRLRALEAARKAAATMDRKGEKNPNAMAAAEKRRIRERFMEARQKGGAPTPELLKASPALTEGDVWKIINGHHVGIDIYRALESALDQIENSITKDEE